MVAHCTESANSLNVDVFKKIASREPIECKRLYENPVTLIDYSRQIFATNVLPKTTESTEGFFRRFLLVPFNQFIPLAERNHQMNTIEFWQESGELSGILNWVVSGLQRLLRNGGFTQSEQSNELLEEYKQDSNSVASFIEEVEYVSDSTHRLRLQELYQEYVEYCRKSNRYAVSDRTMAERLRNMGFRVEKGTGNKTFVYCVKIMTI